MDLIAELKRRKVFKVGAAYVVVAWLVVQVASIAFPAFDAPPWVLRVFILIAFLGLPIALVFAWAFDFQPEGIQSEVRSRSDKVIFVIAAILVALAFVWYFKGQPAERAGEPLKVAAAPAAAVVAPPVVNPQSIAVLPFVNMSDDEDNEFFSDGISEELLNALVRVDGLGVASRTSSFGFKGTKLPTSDIARQLKVRYVLEGSVRKQGQAVRITAQLIDASNDRHVWSETYDRQLTDIFKIQDDIANAIVAALRGKLGKQPERAVSIRADTENMQAYELYLKARELFIGRRDLEESVRLFERAVEMDPNFARGWEGLAAVSSIMRSWGFSDRDYSALARTSAERALKLDPSLSMPWAALAQEAKSKWPVDHAEVLRLLDKAIAADPRNATAVLWRSISWVDMGFFDRAIADQDLCLKLEPGYHNCRSHKMLALVSKGDEVAAIAEFNRSVADGAFGSRSENMLPTLVHRGDDTAALLLMDNLGFPPPVRDMVLGAIKNPAAPHPPAKAVVAQYLSDPGNLAVKNVGLTHFYFWLGDYDTVADNDDASMATVIAWERYPASFRNSPQMKRRLRNEGVVDYWRKHGYPPQCRAVGADDFTCDLPVVSR